MQYDDRVPLEIHLVETLSTCSHLFSTHREPRAPFHLFTYPFPLSCEADLVRNRPKARRITRCTKSSTTPKKFGTEARSRFERVSQVQRCALQYAHVTPEGIAKGPHHALSAAEDREFATGQVKTLIDDWTSGFLISDHGQQMRNSPPERAQANDHPAERKFVVAQAPYQESKPSREFSFAWPLWNPTGLRACLRSIVLHFGL